MENETDLLQAEVDQQSVLLDRGLEFEVGDRKYTIAQPRLGQLDKIATYLIRLDLNNLELDHQEWTRRFNEQKRIINPNLKLAAKVIAIASINHQRRSLILFPWYALKEQFLIWRAYKLFLYNLSPTDMFRLVQVVLKTSRLQDFTNSIALLSINRITAPLAIEDDHLE